MNNLAITLQYGPRRANTCYRRHLTELRNASLVREYRNAEGYLMVELAQRRQVVVTISGKVLDPADTPELPSRIKGHILNWMRYANRTAPKPTKINGRAFCTNNGWLDKKTDTLTPKGQFVLALLEPVAYATRYYVNADGSRDPV